GVVEAVDGGEGGGAVAGVAAIRFASGAQIGEVQDVIDVPGNRVAQPLGEQGPGGIVVERDDESVDEVDDRDAAPVAGDHRVGLDGIEEVPQLAQGILELAGERA